MIKDVLVCTIDRWGIEKTAFLGLLGIASFSVAVSIGAFFIPNKPANTLSNLIAIESMATIVKNETEKENNNEN